MAHRLIIPRDFCPRKDFFVGQHFLGPHTLTLPNSDNTPFDCHHLPSSPVKPRSLAPVHQTLLSQVLSWVSGAQRCPLLNAALTETKLSKIHSILGAPSLSYTRPATLQGGDRPVRTKESWKSKRLSSSEMILHCLYGTLERAVELDSNRCKFRS